MVIDMFGHRRHSKLAQEGTYSCNALPVEWPIVSFKKHILGNWLFNSLRALAHCGWPSEVCQDSLRDIIGSVRSLSSRSKIDLLLNLTQPNKCLVMHASANAASV